MGLDIVIWVSWGINYLFVLSVNLLVRYFKRFFDLGTEPKVLSWVLDTGFCCVDNSEKEAVFSPKQAFLKVRADLAFLPLLSQIG